MTSKNCILRVAVATPLRRLFDYLPPDKYDIKQTRSGLRVSVPFGKRNHVLGILVSISDKSDYPIHKLKKINHFIDQQPVLDSRLFELIIWASRYYHHPIGEVLLNALPTWLRKENKYEKLEKFGWKLTQTGTDLDLNELKRAPKQAQILNYFKQHRQILGETELDQVYPKVKPVLLALEQKELIERTAVESSSGEHRINKKNLVLNKDQNNAINKICRAIGTPSVFLLDGLTGSGKTEVYMAAVEDVLNRQKQSLILLPEIGLTPQLIQRFKDRFDCPVAIQHSGLSDYERVQYWHDAKTGKARIILGTRSAVWTPLADPGLYIVDEEHDLSYKQQDGFRYSAKDMLIIRASKDNVPIILGSATPSLESLYNINKKQYEHLELKGRAGLAKPPVYQLIDIRGKKMHGPLSQTLIDAIDTHLKNKNQVLLFLNRRGYAVNLICHQCGWKAMCERCELPYTFHKLTNKLICHHCDSHRKNITHCPDCDGDLVLLGHGTERIEEILTTIFPDKTVARIDRDTTRKKGSMDSILNDIHSGAIDILIGTQMLAKGHHFPNVTLTAIIDADRGLFSTDFRASERLAQLFMQVSGRTGRGEKEGTVLVQTYNPEHPLFHQLINYGYNRYANALLEECRSASLPPHSYMALLRAESHAIDDAEHFIHQAAKLLKDISNNALSIFGPVPALIEKRSGRFRLQLIIQSNNRNTLHKHLDEWLLQLEAMKLSKKVRWSLDIDPQDMS